MINHAFFILLVAAGSVISIRTNFDLPKSPTPALSVLGFGILLFSTLGFVGLFLDVENYVTAAGNHWLMATVLSLYIPYILFMSIAPVKFFHTSSVSVGRWLFLFAFLSYLAHAIFAVIGSITYYGTPLYPEILMWIGYGFGLLLWIGYFAIVMLKDPPGHSSKKRM